MPVNFIAAVTTTRVSWPADREAGLAVGWTVCLTLLAALIIFRHELARFAANCWRSVTVRIRGLSFRRAERSSMRQRLELEVAALRDQLTQMESGLGAARLSDHSEGFAEMRASLDVLAQQVERADR